MTRLATIARLTGRVLRGLADQVDPTGLTAQAPATLETAAWLAGSTQQLWCEPGKHEWSRLSVRGRKPTACPDHR